MKREPPDQSPPRKSVERHAILRISGGPLCDTRAILRPGHPLYVGRSASAAFIVPHDERMSGFHFELSWDGKHANLKDLSSITGTFLNGVRVERGPVPDGSWIRAGRTDFAVYLEREVPPLAIPSEPPGLARRRAEALELLYKQDTPLYAILDAARSERILVLLHHAVEEYRSLYEGAEGEALERVAPYLVSLGRQDSWLLGRLIEEGWGESWGIYLSCSQPLRELRRHLRKFLMVEAEGYEDKLYFRFYDPRVLRSSLPVLTAAQRKEFFGPIWRFLLEGGGGEALCERPR